MIFGRIVNGVVIIGISINYLFRRPKVLCFLLFFLLSVVAISVFSFFIIRGLAPVLPMLGVLLLPISVCTIFFSGAFFAVATIDYLCCQLDEVSRSVRDSLRSANERKSIILKCVLFNTMVLSIIVSISKLILYVGDIVRHVALFFWIVATFFVGPLILERRDSLVAIFKKSSTLGSRWVWEILGFDLSRWFMCVVAVPIFLIAVNYAGNGKLYDFARGCPQNSVTVSSCTSCISQREVKKYNKKFDEEWNRKQEEQQKQNAGINGFLNFLALYNYIIFAVIGCICIFYFASIPHAVFAAAAFNYIKNKGTGPFRRELFEGE